MINCKIKRPYFLLLFCLWFSNFKAQNKSFTLTDWYTSLPVNGSSTFNHSTFSGQHHSHSFDFKNISTKTQVYEVTRYDLRRNIISKGDSAYAHFCVGANCFSSDTKSFTFTVNPAKLIFYVLNWTKQANPVIHPLSIRF